MFRRSRNSKQPGGLPAASRWEHLVIDRATADARRRRAMFRRSRNSKQPEGLPSSSSESTTASNRPSRASTAARSRVRSPSSSHTPRRSAATGMAPRSSIQSSNTPHLPECSALSTEDRNDGSSDRYDQPSEGVGQSRPTNSLAASGPDRGRHHAGGQEIDEGNSARDEPEVALPWRRRHGTRVKSTTCRRRRRAPRGCRLGPCRCCRPVRRAD